MNVPETPEDPALPETPSPIRVVAPILLLPLVGLFCACAWLRRLNFDESLALRAGWLSVDGFEARPAFLMPTTWLWGWVGHWISDPGFVLSTLRVTVVLAVGSGLVWALRAPGFRRDTATATVILLLCEGQFATHGYEFRYDGAVLVGLLVAYGAVVRGGSKGALVLGSALAWLALHQMKGVYFALGVLVVAAVAARWPTRGSLDLRRLTVGAAVVAGPWALLVLATGRFGEWIDTYRQFGDLALSSERPGLIETLGSSFAREPWWWVTAVGIGLLVSRLVRERRGGRRDVPRHLVAAAGLALVGLGFLGLHPHPWPYLLILPAPFLAILTVEGVERVFGAGRSVPVLLMVLVAGGWLHQSDPLDPYSQALTAPRDEQVATLRVLDRLTTPDTPVHDPSGLAYLRRPCQPDWYVDTLFVPAVEAGEWMAGLHDLDPGECPAAVLTYRQRMLGRPHLLWIQQNFVFVGGGIALRGPVWEADPVDLREDHPFVELRSYWW